MVNLMSPRSNGRDGPKDTSVSKAFGRKNRQATRKRKVVFACTAFALGMILLSLAAELAVRLVAPQPLIPRYVTDSGFGIRMHTPSISTHHTTADYRISIRTNSLGIRADCEHPFSKVPGVLRIVGLGDSFTFGYGVEVEDTYLARLEQLLNQEGIHAEVINLGVAGHGTAEELVMFLNLGLKFDPDLVIVGYYENDLTDSVRSALYALDNRGSLTRDQSQYLPGVKIRDRLYSFAGYRFLAERSHLLYFVRDKLSVIAHKRLDRERGVTSSAHSGSGARLTAALLDEIKNVCVERGIAFRVLVIPSNTATSTCPLELLTEVTEDDIVDLRPVFQELMPSTNLYWTRSDGHWTPAAHRVAAETLTERISNVFSARQHAR